MPAMKVSYEDKVYIFDIEEMDTDQAKAMEGFGVPNLKSLAIGMVEGDLRALTVAFWLMKQQDGAKTRLEAISFKPLKFASALDKAEPVDAEPDPKDEAA